MAFNLTSKSFENGLGIPSNFTCDGDDVSPPLRWDDVPKNTISFALIMEDPDYAGGVFTHWIIYNIPREARSLETIIPIQKSLDNGGIQGKNDFGKIGYSGPCPPKGEEHRYVFKLFALKRKIPRETANRRDDFYKAIKDIVIESAEYMGVYRRLK
jgi:Raf kinase inhibitor-like YbhB/YbcL family protein